MILTRYLAWSVAAAISLAAPLRAAEGHPPASFALSLASPEGLVPRGVEVTAQTYLGRKAVRVVESAAPPAVEQAIALLREPRFQDGTIDVDVAGKPRPGSDPGARGFVGIAFRSAADASAFECIYIRPTNGRASDQLRRNHSTQYISHPEYDFARFRKESPGVYESYVDLETGAWTHMRIQVAGTAALLFVNGSAQPVLVVNDLKHGVSAGQLALWIGDGTEAYFSDFRVRIEK